MDEAGAVTWNFEFGVWDWLLLAVVSLMGTAIAYLHPPRWKALVLSLPFPFTLASLSLGEGVNGTHAMGLLLLILYTHGVRLLYVNYGWPIVGAIGFAVGATAVCVAALAPIVPRSEGFFWGSLGTVFLFGLALYRTMPHRVEPGHRTPLPVWIKLPLIAGVVLGLIVCKKMMHGFMVMFPMVGIVAAYEARHSLWTICRQLTAFTFCVTPMLAMIHLAQPAVGQAKALALGWVVYLMVLLPFTQAQWRAARRHEGRGRRAEDCGERG